MTFDQLDRDVCRKMLRGNVERFGLAHRVPKFIVDGMAENSQLTTELHRASGDLVVRLMHDVYSFGSATKTIKFDAVFFVPDTWIDALKQRLEHWIPRIVLHAWPIKIRTLRKSESVTVDARALLPGIPVTDQHGIEIAYVSTERCRKTEKEQ